VQARKLVAILAAPLAAFLLACGSSASDSKADKPAASPSPVTTVKVGEALTLTTDILGTKTRLKITLSNLRVAKPKNSFEKPSNGQFLVADVAAEVLEGKVSVGSSSFKFVAADGVAYNSGYMSDVKDFYGSDLTTGQKTSGQIAFDVKPGAQAGGKIALTDVFASGDAGYWMI
jgi:hypothetical protein